MTWRIVGHPIARLNRDRRSSLKGVGYVVHPDSLANRFLNDLISAVDQRIYNGWY